MGAVSNSPSSLAFLIVNFVTLSFSSGSGIFFSTGLLLAELDGVEAVRWAVRSRYDRPPLPRGEAGLLRLISMIARIWISVKAKSMTEDSHHHSRHLLRTLPHQSLLDFQEPWVARF